MLRGISLALFGFFLGACSKGPSESDLRSDAGKPVTFAFSENPLKYQWTATVPEGWAGKNWSQTYNIALYDKDPTTQRHEETVVRVYCFYDAAKVDYKCDVQHQGSYESLSNTNVGMDVKGTPSSVTFTLEDKGVPTANPFTSAVIFTDNNTAARIKAETPRQSL